MGLQELPLETLQQIVGYLSSSYRPSVYAFSLISRTCHDAATRFIFDQIHLTVRNRESLQRDTDALVKILSRTDSARHVSCLSLEGLLDIQKPMNEKGFAGLINHLSWWESARLDEPHISEFLPHKEPIPDERYYAVYDESVIESRSEEDKAWAPVVNLVKRLPSLTKMVYNCPNQFPPSLLDVLHEYHPQCKLHHLTFRLRTLLWDSPYPYEMALATSPCLYNAKVLCSWRDSDGDDDFNEDAIMELVAGLAPNLKEVSVINFKPALWDRLNNRRGRWQGLPGFTSGKMIGRLTSLAVLGQVRYGSPQFIQKYAEFTDFSSLTSLAIGGEHHGWVRDGLNGEMMEWIAQNCCFLQLKTLRLIITRDDVDLERPGYTNQAISFFSILNPLEELSVTGPLNSKILDAILSQHGQRLKRLKVRPLERQYIYSFERSLGELPMILTKEHMLQIQAHCPLLEELAVPVKRMKSNIIEVEVYRTFAKMERLRSLFLLLDCSDWHVTRDGSYEPLLEPSFDAEDHMTWVGNGSIKTGHLREAMINSAVDEALARSIWDTINRDKVGTPLECLKLWTTGGGEFGDGQRFIDSFILHMSRSWQIERVPRDDKDVISIKELGQLAREASDQVEREREKPPKKQVKTDKYWRTVTVEQWQEDMANGELPEPLEPGPDEYVKSVSRVMPIFRRIWPRKEGSKNWREDWSSIPLQI